MLEHQTFLGLRTHSGEFTFLLAQTLFARALCHPPRRHQHADCKTHQTKHTELRGGGTAACRAKDMNSSLGSCSSHILAILFTSSTEMCLWTNSLKIRANSALSITPLPRESYWWSLFLSAVLMELTIKDPLCLQASGRLSSPYQPNWTIKMKRCKHSELLNMNDSSTEMMYGKQETRSFHPLGWMQKCSNEIL